MTPKCLYGECPCVAIAQVKVGAKPARRLCGSHLATVLTDATFTTKGMQKASVPKVRVVLLAREEEP